MTAPTPFVDPASDAQYHLARGLRFEKSGALDRALREYEAAIAVTADAALAAEALRRQSSAHRTRCEWADALRTAQRSADVARGAELHALVGEAMVAEAAVHQTRGEFAAAVALLERVEQVTTDARARGIAQQNLGVIAAEGGDLVAAERRFADSLQQFEQADYRWGCAFALNNLGRVALDRRDLARAEVLLEQAAAAAGHVEDLDLQAIATLNRAEVLFARGVLDRAEEMVSAALGYFVYAGNDWRRVECLRLFGDIARAQQRTATALRCYREGAELARQIDARHEAQILDARLAALDAR